MGWDDETRCQEEEERNEKRKEKIQISECDGFCCCCFCRLSFENNHPKGTSGHHDSGRWYKNERIMMRWDRKRREIENKKGILSGKWRKRKRWKTDRNVPVWCTVCVSLLETVFVSFLPFFVVHPLLLLSPYLFPIEWITSSPHSPINFFRLSSHILSLGIIVIKDHSCPKERSFGEERITAVVIFPLHHSIPA